MPSPAARALAALLACAVTAPLTAGCSDDTANADAAAPPADDAAPPATDDAAPPVVRILPLGDSLTLGFGSATEGAGSEGGYRLHLAARLRAEGLAVDFVGSQSNGPAALDGRDHEGYNGYAVAQIAGVADAAMAAFAPDIVLLLAGTNDQIEAVPPWNTTQRPTGRPPTTFSR